MRSLTLHRPWTDAIVSMPEPHAKRIENRSWRPPQRLVGEHIAIHAGQRYDVEGAEWIAGRVALFRPRWSTPSAAESPVGIVGVARLAGVIDCDRFGQPLVVHGAVDLSSVEIGWWMGGPGWVLDQVVAIEPVPCRGRQGLWTVPAAELDLVRVRWKAASRD